MSEVHPVVDPVSVSRTLSRTSLPQTPSTPHYPYLTVVEPWSYSDRSDHREDEVPGHLCVTRSGKGRRLR